MTDEQRPAARWHRMAMIWMDNYKSAERHLAQAAALQKAFAFESTAARLEDHELTRAVYYRSAASIAILIPAPGPAAVMVAEALEKPVPRELVDELVDVLREAISLGGFQGPVPDARTTFPKLAKDYGLIERPDPPPLDLSGYQDPHTRQAYCLMCGHEPCPACRMTTCDISVATDDDVAICCSGGCIYSVYELAAWLQHGDVGEILYAITQTGIVRRTLDRDESAIRASAHEKLAIGYDHLNKAIGELGELGIRINKTLAELGDDKEDDHAH